MLDTFSTLIDLQANFAPYIDQSSIPILWASSEIIMSRFWNHSEMILKARFSCFLHRRIEIELLIFRQLSAEDFRCLFDGLIW